MTEKTNIATLVESQKKYFLSGESRDISFRLARLKLLKQKIEKCQPEIIEALKKDLRKSEFESYATEIGSVLAEINWVIKKLPTWARAKRVRTPWFLFPALSKIYREPYGVSLIIAPWNYPFQLCMQPLIGAIAGGNCAILKPSEYTPHTAELIERMIHETFDTDFVEVLLGGREVATELLAQPVDMIFFTGSTSVGKIVLASAAKNLTPVVLELGGKSPTLIDKTANLDAAAKKITWGKFLNAGQTCIAPDFVYIEESVKNEFLGHMEKWMHHFFGEDAQTSPDFGRIVSKRHFDRIEKLLTKGHTILGGKTDKTDLYIAPTLIDDVSWDDPIMKEEIFGPVLPILTFTDINEVVQTLQQKPKALACYIFSKNHKFQKKIIRHLSFGNGCVNDVIIQLSNANLPFGGVGASGMGSYHGKRSFEAFSHAKSILKKYGSLHLILIAPPYSEKKLHILKNFWK
jgi:aldehyde dehydrogenase (NAD+)